MNIVIFIVVGLVGVGIGIALATTKLRSILEKKSQQVLKEAEEKAEVLAIKERTRKAGARAKQQGHAVRKQN